MNPLGQARFFPPLEMADDDGVVAIGGALSIARLIDAYSHGIFPWPDGAGIVEWCSPPVRAVFEFDRFYVSRRLARTCRSGRFTVTCNENFPAVMRGCATANERAYEGTWITPDLYAAYCRLHHAGYAHSVECWLGDELVGGVYGVSIGGYFAAESAFYLERDASKVALTHLVTHLETRGYTLLDIQQWTPHSASLGCTPILREEFFERLAIAMLKPVTFGTTLELPGPIVARGKRPARLIEDWDSLEGEI